MKTEINNNSYKKGINFLREDNIIGPYIKKLSPPKYKLDNNYFQSLCKYIIYQQLSIASASKTFDRFKNLITNIKPPILLTLDDDDLKNTGISKRKVEYLKELSRNFIRNNYYKNIDKKTNKEVIKCLSKIKGVGSWTSEMFLIFTLGRIDVFSLKDIGLLNGLKTVFKLSNRPSTTNAELLIKRWSPYKTLAALYLWKIIDGDDFNW